MTVEPADNNQLAGSDWLACGDSGFCLRPVSGLVVSKQNGLADDSLAGMTGEGTDFEDEECLEALRQVASQGVVHDDSSGQHIMTSEHWLAMGLVDNIF